MKKTKEIENAPTDKIQVSRNRVSGKKKVDLFARLRNDEHPLDNIFPETVAFVEDTKPIQPILSNDNPSYPILDKTLQKPVAPTKDFQRVPNSITRDAVPNKFFKGTSKSTYDALYLRTRGAINPVRTIKATKRELMKWIGISHVTIFKHLKHLESVRLIKIEQQLGSHNGSIYEVLIPEETEPTPTHASPSYPMLSNTTKPILGNDSQSNAIQSNNLVSVPYNNLVLDSMGNPVEDKGTYKNTKTSLKTNTISDDDALTKFAVRMNEVSRKLTNKGLKKDEEGKWEELAELLAMELEIAAARTKSISNVPAFLTEHLRRRLIGKSAAIEGKAKTSKPAKAGEQEETVEEYEAEPLTEQGREAVLKTIQEYIGKGQEDFVMSQQDTYTKVDWDWLMKELK
jgi:hypothetical protein